MIDLKLDQQEQVEVIEHVLRTSTFYDNQMSTYKDKMLDIYQSVTTFTQERRAQWQTTFKVNKPHEVVNKIQPRIMARNPRWIVSFKTDEFDAEDRQLTPEQRAAKMEALKDIPRAIQDQLDFIFEKDALKKTIRAAAKSMITYGNAYAAVCYKYELGRDYMNDEEKQVDEVTGEEIVKSVKNIKEKVIAEYPSVDLVSWADVLYDARYRRMEDFPCIIRLKRGVRLSEFTKNKSKYMNVDKLEQICAVPYTQQDLKAYKQSIRSITGLNSDLDVEQVDRNNLVVKIYQGYFEFPNKDGQKTGVDEKLYEFHTVNDMVLVQAQEISQITYAGARCFEDPETYYATGFVEPILGLTEEMNFKKNAASQAINQSLNREWIWSPNSRINPRDLISKPGNIIVTAADAQTALANCVELPFRPIPNDYFQEQNDFERQIQSMTFTVDTSNQQNSQALTNTATGIKVKFFESNSVIDEVRKHFEEFLEDLAYKLLQTLYENMDNNVVIKKLGDEGFWQVNKEAYRDALRRYAIRVEIGSSSFDSEEQRREDAIARGNIAMQYAQA